VYLTLDGAENTDWVRFGDNLDGIGKNNIGFLDISSSVGSISFTNRTGAITAPILDWDTEKQTLPNIDVDAVIQFELYYYAFGSPRFGGQRWTIRNGLFDYQEDGTAAYDADGVTPTGQGITTGSWIPVRFGKGNGAITGFGVKVGPK
jgi:hypothetical protein